MSGLRANTSQVAEASCWITDEPLLLIHITPTWIDILILQFDTFVCPKFSLTLDFVSSQFPFHNAMLDGD